MLSVEFWMVALAIVNEEWRMENSAFNHRSEARIRMFHILTFWRWEVRGERLLLPLPSYQYFLSLSSYSLLCNQSVAFSLRECGVAMRIPLTSLHSPLKTEQVLLAKVELGYSFRSLYSFRCLRNPKICDICAILAAFEISDVSYPTPNFLLSALSLYSGVAIISTSYRFASVLW